MQNLIANKEDTEQVFQIIEALNGGSLLKNLQAFAQTESGALLLQKREYLPPLLDDHEWIRALPEDSVGRAYIDFMEREGLSAQGLVEESEKMRAGQPVYEDDLEWYAMRMRDTHDLFHVLTGYGRDALGEACLLAFTYSQNPGRGVIFIAHMAGRHLSKLMPKEADIKGCIQEGKASGAMASKIIQEDILALLHEPLDEARKRLNIAEPVAYRNALAVFEAHGVSTETIMAAA